MVRQATLKNGASTSIDGVIDGIGDLGNNVFTLATLQARLAAMDLREMVGQVIPAAVSVALLIPLYFAGFTALVFGLAYWVSASLQLPLAAALAIVGSLAIVLAAILAFFAWRRFSASLTTFRRSREELDRNVAWLGTIVKQSGR